MWRAIASNALTLLVVLLVGVAVAVAWGRNAYVAPGPSAAAQCIEIPQGAKLDAVDMPFAVEADAPFAAAFAHIRIAAGAAKDADALKCQ